MAVDAFPVCGAFVVAQRVEEGFPEGRFGGEWRWSGVWGFGWGSGFVSGLAFVAPLGGVRGVSAFMAMAMAASVSFVPVGAVG